MLDKWKEWFGIIEMDIAGLSYTRCVIYEVGKIISNNPEIKVANPFYAAISRTYAAFAVMALRRHLKSDKRSISLVRLLENMTRFPNAIPSDTRNILLPATNKSFSRSEQITNEMAALLISNDKDELKKELIKIEDYGDCKIAHIDKRGISVVPTFGELDEGIDLLEKMTNKYSLVILNRPQDYSNEIPDELFYIFKVPWIRPEYILKH